MTGATAEKYRKFVELLYKKTVSKELKWSVGFDSNIFVDIGLNQLLVRTGNNPHGEDLVVFEILNREHVRADIFNDETLIGGGGKPQNFENWFLLCQAVYDLGMRHATGADDILDDMIMELDDEIPF